MADEPQIAVLTGICNSEDMLGEAIESIFAQFYTILRLKDYQI